MALDSVRFNGSFTSNGSGVTIVLRSGVDWCNVWNWTQMATTESTGVGVQYRWQNGMPAGYAIEYKKTNSSNALNGLGLTTGGFTYMDTSTNAPGPLVAVTSINGTGGANGCPRVLVGSTAGLVTGQTVRMINITGGLQISGMDFTIGVVDSTHFDLIYMQGIANATSGNYRTTTSSYWSPAKRLITNISAATQAIITMAVTHNFTVGQQIRVDLPSSAFGMTQINGLTGNILAINAADANGETNTITTDINSSGFTAFTFPVSASVPFTVPQVVPVGENTGVALANPPQNILADALYNTAYTGLYLAAGANSPAGSTNDLIYWEAGKDFSSIPNAPLVLSPNGYTYLVTNQF